MTGMNGDKPTDPTRSDEFQVIDKRHFSGPDGASSGAPVEEKPRYPTFVEELMGKVSEMEKRFEQKRAEMQSELSRTRTRLETDYERRIQLEKQKMLLPLLDVLDNLERAIDSANRAGDRSRLLEGVEMTRSLFLARLQSQGFESLAVVDLPFDPNTSEAIGTIPVSETERDGLALEEVKRGYRMGDQLVRPAQVRVGRLEPSAGS